MMMWRPFTHFWRPPSIAYRKRTIRYRKNVIKFILGCGIIWLKCEEEFFVWSLQKLIDWFKFVDHLQISNHKNQPSRFFHFRFSAKFKDLPAHYVHSDYNFWCNSGVNLRQWRCYYVFMSLYQGAHGHNEISQTAILEFTFEIHQ